MNDVIRNNTGGITGLSVDISTLTFRQFKALLPGTEGQKLATLRALRASGVQAIAIAETDDGTLTVFRNGFFTYETKSGHATVYAVDRCSSIVLNPTSDDPTSVLDETSFGDCPWPKVLEFVASERITNNISRNAERHEVLSIDVEPEYWDAQMSVQPELETRLDEEVDRKQEAQLIETAKSVLTARQWEVLYLYYGKGLTQEEIAITLMIPQSSVSITLKRSLQNLQRKFQATK